MMGVEVSYKTMSRGFTDCNFCFHAGSEILHRVFFRPHLHFEIRATPLCRRSFPVESLKKRTELTNSSDTSCFSLLHHRLQGNVNFLHHYWSGAYGEKPQKSAFTRFEGETARLYQVLEDQLQKQEQRGSSFIALDRPTIADFAFWTWVRIAGFGNIDLSPYPAVQKWCATIENDAKSQAAIQKLPIK